LIDSDWLLFCWLKRYPIKDM